MNKIKISELPICSSLTDLYTIGTDVLNNSVRFPIGSLILGKEDSWKEVSSTFEIGSYKYLRVYAKCEDSSILHRQAVADLYIGDLTSGGVIANRLLFYGDRDNSIIGGLTATRNGSTVYVGVQLGTAYSSYTISMSKILVK